MLHAIEQAASPDEVNRKEAKAEQNDEPAWARSYKQDDAERQKRESAKDAKRSPSLLKRLENKWWHDDNLPPVPFSRTRLKVGQNVPQHRL